MRLNYCRRRATLCATGTHLTIWEVGWSGGGLNRFTLYYMGGGGRA